MASLTLLTLRYLSQTLKNSGLKLDTAVQKFCFVDNDSSDF